MKRKKRGLLWRVLLGLLTAGAALAADDPAMNNLPRIVGLESVSFAENSSEPVATYTARHAQGNSIICIWSLTGRDAGAFTYTTDMEHQTMTLLFRAIPDYEQPADVPPTDNDYQVTVVATASAQPALATSYPVRVQVVDVADASPMPEIAQPEQMRSTTQAEYVGRMVWAVIDFYKGVVSWAVRGVVHHLRDVFNASTRTPKSDLAPVPDAPEVSVYAGAWSALATSGRLHVSVDQPVSNGSALLGYEYQLYEGDERLLDWTSAGIAMPTGAGFDGSAEAPVEPSAQELATGASASFSVGGLQHGHTYAVAVRAINAEGASGAVWGLATPGRLFAPDRLQAVAGDGWVALEWSAAASEGPVLTRYEWRGRPVWGAWSEWEPMAGGAAARSHRVEGLANGVEYAFAVRAANPAGAGAVAQVAARTEVVEPAPAENAPL